MYKSHQLRQWDKTSLQKIVFLLTKSYPNDLNRYNNDFVPYDFGPYSEEVEEDVAWMQTIGVLDYQLKVREENNNLITQIESLNPEIIDHVDEFMTGFIDLNRDELLYIVYNLYPTYITSSKIVRKVNKLVKFESFKIPLSKLEETQTLQIVSDKGNVVSVRLENGKLIVKDFEEGDIK